MTITEAEQNWKLSRNTIFGYIADGLIDKLSVENNQIILPNVPKPKKIKINCKRSSENIYRWILKACNDNEYINAKLMGIDENRFLSHIQQLEKEKYIVVKNHDSELSSNLDCQITPKGIKSLTSKSFKIALSPTIEFNMVKAL